MSLPEGIEIFKHIVPKEYHWTEYFVFSAVLVFSTAIPIFDKMIYNKNLVSFKEDLCSRHKSNSVMLVSFSMVGR